MEVLAILLGGSFMIMAGFIDDQFGLPPVFRLLVQLIAALLLVSVGIRIEVVFGGSSHGALSVILTVLWIMAITNAVNLIDGVDGLAGGVSFITAMSLLAVSAQDQSKAAATIVLAAVARRGPRLPAAQPPALAHHHGRQWRLLLRLRAGRVEHPGRPQDHHGLLAVPHRALPLPAPARYRPGDHPHGC